MTEYGIWDAGAGGFVEAQFYTEASTQAAFAEGGWSTEAGDRVREICPDHEEQPRDECEECFDEDDEPDDSDVAS